MISQLVACLDDPWTLAGRRARQGLERIQLAPHHTCGWAHPGQEHERSAGYDNGLSRQILPPPQTKELASGITTAFNLLEFLGQHMKTKSYLAVGGIVTMLLGQAATADDTKIHFKLPNCPTEMTLLAPDAFRGAASREDLLKAYQPFLFAETRGVFAATSSEKPDVALLVVEPNRVSEAQGTITPEQFSQVKAAMLAKNPSSAVMEANQILEDKDTSIDEYDGIVQSSTNTSATVTLVLDGTTTGAGFTSLTGFKMIYADNCLAGVILIAPKLSIARREFEEMIQVISIE